MRTARTRCRRRAGLVFALWAAVLVCGCQTSFDPFQESDFHYSIFGYLDAGADTQFVRITPVRDSIAVNPAPIDGEVVLEHVATGRRAVLRDSLFRYADGRVAHNFWTTMPVEPGETYRLLVTRSDGATSSATVTLPPAFPPPIYRVFREAPPVVEMPGIRRLAELQLVYVLRDRRTGQVGDYFVSYMDRVSYNEAGFSIRLNASDDLEQIGRGAGGVPREVVRLEIVVAAAGPDWPDLEEIDEETMALPDVVNNVENGVGFLGGIRSGRYVLSE